MRLRTLQLGNIDTVGDRFNGQELHKRLLARGVDSSHAVWQKEAHDPLTAEFSNVPFRKSIHQAANELERKLSVQSLLYPFSWLLPFETKFQLADLIHYHLIHTGYFSLASLPLLTSL